MGGLEGPRLMPDAGRRDPQEEVLRLRYLEKKAVEKVFTPMGMVSYRLMGIHEWHFS